MKRVKLIVAATATAVAGFGAMSFKTPLPKKGTPQAWQYNGAQTKASYNNPANYSSASPSCTGSGVLCEITANDAGGQPTGVGAPFGTNLINAGFSTGGSVQGTNAQIPYQVKAS
jgi:hypothetical protein